MRDEGNDGKGAALTGEPSSRVQAAVQRSAPACRRLAASLVTCHPCRVSAGTCPGRRGVAAEVLIRLQARKGSGRLKFTQLSICSLDSTCSLAKAS